MTLIETTEVVGMITDTMNLSLAFMTLYLSTVTGYLIIAYLAGSKLTKFQAGLITVFFLVFSVHFTISSFGTFELASTYTMQYLPETEHGPSIVMNRTLTIFQMAGIVGCLKFMWDVRKKIEDK
jgi:hypothetical protein